MKNFVQNGLSLDYIAPAGGVVSGVALLIGTILVMPATTAAEGQPFAGWIVGVYELPCATGTAWSMHDVLYWDDANKRVTTTVGANRKIGFAAAPKVAGAASGNVRLVPQI